MWIEATNALLMSQWFKQVKKKLIELSIEKQIPILVCVYEKQ
jgi:hypothetical protein